MRHFRLSLFGHVVSLMVITGIAAFGLCIELHKSVIQETFCVMMAIWGLFTVYFWAMLYGGIRFDRGLVDWWKEYLSKDDAKDVFGNVADVSGVLGWEDDLFGWLLSLAGFVGVLLIAFLAPLLIWAGVNAAIIMFLSLFFALYWVFRRGLRLVMANMKRCRGEYFKSLYVAALHSFGYTLFFGTVVFISESVIRALRS